MRIVLDTNVLISALITKGTPPDRLYQAWLRSEIELVTCPAQLAELADVLARTRLRKFVDPDQSAAIVENMDTRAIIFHNPPDVNLSPDPHDNPILAAAIAGKADLIVSGDKKHMLSLGKAEGIPIVTAREALDLVSKYADTGSNAGSGLEC